MIGSKIIQQQCLNCRADTASLQTSLEYENGVEKYVYVGRNGRGAHAGIIHNLTGSN